MSVRVLLASPRHGSGGIAKWTDHILSYYQSNCHNEIELDLLSMDRRPFSNFIMRLLCGIWDYSKVILKARSNLKHHHYDVIHICTSGSISYIKDIILLFMTKRFHARAVIHLHYGRIPQIIKEKNWEWILLQKVLALADACITIDRSSFYALLSANQKNVFNIPNPLATTVERFVEMHENDSNRDEKMVLFVGHCLKTKGVYELVEACKDISGIRLVLVGMISDSVRADLETLSSKDMTLNVLGERPYEETLNLMMQCGVFVLPSYTEGFPNVILESMACGCAIIATTVGAIPEMIGEENGKQYGVLVPPKNVEALKNALFLLLKDSVLSETCRTNVRYKVKRYSIVPIWTNLVELWEQVGKKE